MKKVTGTEGQERQDRMTNRTALTRKTGNSGEMPLLDLRPLDGALGSVSFLISPLDAPAVGSGWLGHSTEQCKKLR